mgnify:CR=1 FL=1
MNGTLAKILGPFVGKDGGTYSKLYFEDKHDRVFYSYAVENNNNYRRWKPIIEAGVGTVVKGMKLYKGALIDADSRVYIDFSKDERLAQK